MSIFNLGSINIDHVYRVAALPGPGETVSDKGYVSGLGGKGVNQSLAAAAAGARVVHIGAIGADGRWIGERLRQAGIGFTQMENTFVEIEDFDLAQELADHLATKYGSDRGKVQAKIDRLRFDWTNFDSATCKTHAD